ncbi:RhoGAP domain containing protein [Tritrichomonas foetus]|uniref:RhoGAP domain containing protein n=1 Tax=Tritrichomonas foetus TaxID=1144522 RepID=A0A1J4JQD9_9EUKA|nr:RhoGAP domain containing protein [Tritrichomonas foetus]|eukprot:OHT00962.1 RhoGAP domain containing protein [Tritrichomonas foetus]
MVEVLSLDLSKIKKGGFLTLTEVSTKTWKKRYFVLHDATLDYFKDQSFKEIIGSIKIVDCTVSTMQEGEMPGFYFTLSISSANSKGVEYVLIAESDADRRAWMREITKVNIVSVFDNELYKALEVNPKKPGYFIPIPFFIVKALKFIEDEALDVEGIYRMNGSAHKIENMVTAINANVNVEFTDIHSTTGLVKLYMRSLKNPVLMHESIPALKALINSPEKQQVELLHNLLRKLPIPNFLFLAYFFKHLCKVIEHEDKNMMKASVLTVCISPALVWQSGNSIDVFSDNSIQQAVFNIMIDNYEALFTDNPLTIYASNGKIYFSKLAQEQDTQWPFTLDAPKGSIVQVLSEDKYGWTVCVFNDKWGAVHKKDLEPVSSPREFLKGISSQTSKWAFGDEFVQKLKNKSPESAQLYELLIEKVRTLREKAAKAVI